MEYLHNIPRNIWMMWSSGIETAPEVVRACVDSWRRHHPAWRLEILDRTSAKDILDVESITGTSVDALDPVVLSDLVRIHLLATRGGVWADATCFCMKPMEQWLEPYVSSGFFAFRNPGRDRLISTWFIAAQPNNRLMTTLRDHAVSYWRKNKFCTPSPYTAIHRKLTHCLSRNVDRTRWWFSWPVTRLLGIYPYFWLHYLFARIVTEDVTCHAIWEATPIFDANGPHALQHVGGGLVKAMSVEARSLVENASAPLFKLSHKFNSKTMEPGSPLDYLINQSSQGVVVNR